MVHQNIGLTNIVVVTAVTSAAITSSLLIEFRMVLSRQSFVASYLPQLRYASFTSTACYSQTLNKYPSLQVVNEALLQYGSSSSSKFLLYIGERAMFIPCGMVINAVLTETNCLNLYN